ncbi:glutamic-type intramembrane protease PrsW [Thalassobacillus pellis]|uniref:glutamic-type intramembrane protease PrsW n=1 Tax=Thalassobacillus pellis TaxID=748008 RepID=UPI00195F684B|nr:glutamic-type intramembrane protease PrsW [Thalassobacillus pellis]MBM7552443.1 RsiW-degrading membrane proteinase PrsW (M82 family) [Thalassobacillus pellis]
MFTILTFAIAPALGLMTFIYLKKRIELEPLPMIIRTFLLGAVLVFPLMFMQYVFKAEGIIPSPVLQSFILAGLLEEFFKWFIFLFAVYKHREFDHPYDGIIYGVAISLGFATVENILYLLSHGVEYAWGRAIFPVSSHALFGILMGYYVGKAKFNTEKTKLCLAFALWIPVALHGLYDMILTTTTNIWMMLMIPFMIGLWFLGLKKIKLANHHTESYLKQKAE